MTTDLQKKKRALIDFIENAKAIRDELTDRMIMNWIPPEWDEIDLFPKDAVPKKKVTLRIDEDVLKIFKAAGPGYTTAMNRVLRTFAMGQVGNALFAREDAISTKEMITGERNMSLEELEKRLKRDAELRKR